MAKVVGNTVESFVPDEWADILVQGLSLTEDNQRPADAHIEQVFTWAEETIQKVREQPDVETAKQTVPEFETLAKLLSKDLVPLVTDDEALTFVDPLPYALKGLAEALGTNPCDGCDEVSCPSHPSKQRLN